MKVISRTSVEILSILLLLHIVASQSTTIIGDIVVTTKNGTLYCDSMACPPEAVSCRVTKRNDPNDFSKIVRIRKCIGPNQETIAEETVFERNTYHGTVNVNVVAGGGYGSNVGRELTPEEQRELEENLRRTQENIRQTQERIQAQLSETLSNTANLRERILADVRNSLNKWY